MKSKVFRENEFNNRVFYFDILKVFSILSIICIHVTATDVCIVDDMNSFKWWVANILNSFSRWAVPVFFMISGALLLESSKEESIIIFLKKRLMRIGIPFIVWSVVYAFIKHYYLLRERLSIFSFLRVLIKELLQDKIYHHLWFLYVMLTLYFVIPFVARMLKNLTQKEIGFGIIIWFIISVLYHTVQGLYYLNIGEYFCIQFLEIPFYKGYLGFFILGYYLNYQEISKRLRRIIYFIGLVSLVVTPVITYYLTRGQEELNEMFYGNFAITTVLTSIAIFILFKNINWTKILNERLMKLIVSISKASFGIYLIHLIVQIFMINSIETSMRLTNLFSPLLNILNIFIIFWMSYFLVKIISLNSFLRKLLFG